MHLFYHPKNLHRHCFRLLLGHLHVPGEIANNDHAKFLGGKIGALWYCASSELFVPAFTLTKSIRKNIEFCPFLVMAHAFALAIVLLAPFAFQVFEKS